jgi:flagellar hook-basal body complex protein FliE
MINGISQISSLSFSNGIGDISKTSSNLMGQATSAASAVAAGPTSFASILGGMATEAMGNIKKAEVSSFEGIKGTANTREVVDSVMAAEQSLQTAIALRDKIVSAYLEVTKMQI